MSEIKFEAAVAVSLLTILNIVLITIVCMHREIAFAEPSTTTYAKRWQRSEGLL